MLQDLVILATVIEQVWEEGFFFSCLYSKKDCIDVRIQIFNQNMNFIQPPTILGLVFAQISLPTSLLGCKQQRDKRSIFAACLEGYNAEWLRSAPCNPVRGGLAEGEGSAVSFAEMSKIRDTGAENRLFCGMRSTWLRYIPYVLCRL